MHISSFIYYEDTNTVEVSWSDNDKVFRCQSYDQCQMDMLRGDVGGLLTPEYESIINTVIANTKPLPPPIVIKPLSVTPRQAKLALLSLGLLDDVETAITNSGKAAQIEWDNALSFERTSPLLITLCSSIGLTSEQLDDMFVLANSL